MASISGLLEATESAMPEPWLQGAREFASSNAAEGEGQDRPG